MHKLVRTGRIFVLFFLVFCILVIYGATLFKMQVVERSQYETDEIDTITTTEKIYATRGDILDRNGILLISNVSSYYITLSRDVLLEHENINEELLTLANLANDYGVEYTDTFPITTEAPFEYVEDMSSTQEYCLSEYIKYFDGLEDQNLSATDLLVWLKNHYGIGYDVPLKDVRKIMGLRYEMELRVIVGLDPYIFVDTASTEFIARLKEKNIPGINIEMTTSRVYHTTYAAHLLGYIGQMNEEEYEYYGKLGYDMNADIGKSGVEAAFEEYLHGQDGVRRVVRAAETDVEVRSSVITEPQHGCNVYLTLDLGVQQAAEDSLLDKISTLNATRSKEDEVTGAAICVEDVRNGGMLAVASYPSYDLSHFFENYDQIIEADHQPLFNRAAYGLYSPGSTYKMVTAYAGMSSGKISGTSTYVDTGKFDKYEDCILYCWNTAGHGELDVVGALENSCNCFFYWLGDMVGERALVKAAEYFGFGETTGIEIDTSSGVVPDEDYKLEAVGENWYSADNMLVAIGQGLTQVTPLQLANYVSSIANGGTLYKQTLLHNVVSGDFTEMIKQGEGSVIRNFDSQSKYMVSILQEGMKAVAATGTAATVFSDYRVPIACKTGTVQSDTDTTNNGVFVCYAPADDPEIAISIVVEKGTSGATIMSIAQDVLDYYFGDRVEYVTVPVENTFVP